MSNLARIVKVMVDAIVDNPAGGSHGGQCSGQAAPWPADHKMIAACTRHSMISDIKLSEMTEKRAQVAPLIEATALPGNGRAPAPAQRM